MAERSVLMQRIDDLFTVDEDLVWAEQQPRGRSELHNGRVVSMSAEPNVYARTKGEAFVALREAIRRAGLNCIAFTDGVTVRTADDTAYGPDVTVQCAEPDVMSMAAQKPVAVVEVLSPSSIGVDIGARLMGYLSVPSIRHVLILDPDRRVVTHHRPDAPPMMLGGGRLILDPPGLDLAVDDMFVAASPPDSEGDD